MAAFNGVQSAIIAAGNEPYVSFVAGRVRCFAEQFVYAAQASGSTITVATLPAGALLLGIELTTDTSTGSATLAFGDGTTAAKFVAAAAYTTTDSQTVLPLKTAPQLALLTAQTSIVITTAAASLPASGNLSILTFYQLD